MIPLLSSMMMHYILTIQNNPLLNRYKCIYSIYPNLEGIQKDGTFKYQISFREKQIYGLNCLFNKKISYC